MKIKKIYEQLDDDSRRELIQDVIERLRLYPDYAEKLKVFNDTEFPINKIVGERGTRYEKPE